MMARVTAWSPLLRVKFPDQKTAGRKRNACAKRSAEYLAPRPSLGHPNLQQPVAQDRTG